MHPGKFLFFLPLLFLAAVLYLIPSTPVTAETYAGETDHTVSYMLEAWTVGEGLPQNSVLCLLQDKTGYIWFGTRSGLVRFDGVAFHIFNRWNTPVLKADTITALYEDNEGTLWIGTENGGAYRKMADEWRAYTVREGLSNNTVRAVLGDGKGNLWIGTANGLNRLDTKNDKIDVHTSRDDLRGNEVTALCIDRSGVLRAGTGGGGLYSIKNGKYEPENTGDDRGKEITALCEDREGLLWIGSEDGLLYLQNGTIQDPVPQGHPLSGSSVRSLLADRSGSILIGTDGEGVYHFFGGRFYPIPFQQDLAINDDFIYAFLQDREGNLWIGTYTSGLVRLTPARVSTITTENGLPQNPVRALMGDTDGGLWIGGHKGVVKIKDNKAIEKIPSVERVTALYRDNAGNTWIGTSNNGITLIESGSTRHYSIGDGLTSDAITVITGDTNDNSAVWIGTTKGLNRFENGRFSFCGKTNRGEADGPAAPVYINTAVDDGKGTLWVGSRNGLLRVLVKGVKGERVKGDRLETVADAGGVLAGRDILSLYPDAEGHLWVGTGGSGLLRLVDGTVTIYSTETGLPDNNIFSILEDDRENLWMSSYHGVFCVSKAQLGAVARKETASVTPLVFDEKDGMRSAECVSGGQPSAWKIAGGILCFPTVKGVALFDPALIRINRVPPGVVVEKVFIDNKPVNPAERAVFSYRARILEFNFTALSFTDPGKVKLRYKLEGYDDGWLEIPPRQKRAALYLNLAPGNYRFRVISCNNDGLWNENGAYFDFKINSPFFNRVPVYLLILIVLSVAVFFYRRTRKKKGKGQKYKTSSLLPETVDAMLPRLVQLMEKEKIFLQADVTLKTLSGRLGVHYNYLSQIINEQFKQNFNDFINKYRIEEAKRMLIDPSGSERTILEIAYDTGFYSKSVFNTAFKKFTGKTPSQYRKDSI